MEIRLTKTQKKLIVTSNVIGHIEENWDFWLKIFQSVIKLREPPLSNILEIEDKINITTVAFKNAEFDLKLEVVAKSLRIKEEDLRKILVKLCWSLSDDDLRVTQFKTFEKKIKL